MKTAKDDPELRYLLHDHHIDASSAKNFTIAGYEGRLGEKEVGRLMKIFNLIKEEANKGFYYLRLDGSLLPKVDGYLRLLGYEIKQEKGSTYIKWIKS